MSLDTSNIISMTRKYVTYDDDEGDDIINSASNNNVRHGLESISQNGYSQKSNIFKCCFSETIRNFLKRFGGM